MSQLTDERRKCHETDRARGMLVLLALLLLVLHAANVKILRSPDYFTGSCILLTGGTALIATARRRA